MRTCAVLFLFLACFSMPLAAQFSSNTSVAPAPAGEPAGEMQTSPQQPAPLSVFNGSGKVDKLVPGVLPISILDAIDRGISHNLGLLLSQQQSEAARARHRRELSALLPNISGNLAESIQQINLAAFGIPLPAGLTSPVIGPFDVFDAHAAMTDRVLDFDAINRVHSASESARAAQFTMQDARELVVLVVGNEYLLTLADSARVDTAKAQLATAQAIFERTEDLKKAGVAAGIDVLRSQVQMQQQQQRVLAAENQYERQKMVFARTIGLSVAQEFKLTDQVPYGPSPELNLQQELERAYRQRPEYLAAQARVRAAELAVKAARGEGLPTVEISGQVGYLGPTPSTSENTYSLAAGLRIPVFQGGRVKADVLQAQAALRQRKMELEDLHSRVEFDVRSALLDVKTSNDQVNVAKQSIDLATEQLKQAQDRYGAGVSGSLEVVQAQEALATANETYIQALYLNNVAKLTLARALGVAEKQTRAFLGGK